MVGQQMGGQESLENVIIIYLERKIKQKVNNAYPDLI